MIANLVGGSIPLTPEGRLTVDLVQSTGTLALNLSDPEGNITTL